MILSPPGAGGRKRAMGRVAVVTDSTADLAPAVAASAGIRVVPLTVSFGGDEYRVGVDISTEAFWDRLTAPHAPFPMTAAPSPGAFREAFEACFADGAEAVVCLTIGSRMSATFASATLGAEALRGREVHVVDTRSTSMATGIPALLAVEMAASGASAAEIAERIRVRLADLDLYVYLGTLEYLRKGGRLSAARATIGTVLSIKPIITVRDGLVTMAEQPRTAGRAAGRPPHPDEPARRGRRLPGRGRRPPPRGHRPGARLHRPDRRLDRSPPGTRLAGRRLPAEELRWPASRSSPIRRRT